MSIDIWYEWHGICVRPCWKAGLDKGKTRGRCAAPAIMGQGGGLRRRFWAELLEPANLELTCQCIGACPGARRQAPVATGWIELETSSAN